MFHYSSSESVSDTDAARTRSPTRPEPPACAASSAGIHAGARRPLILTARNSRASRPRATAPAVGRVAGSCGFTLRCPVPAAAASIGALLQRARCEDSTGRRRRVRPLRPEAAAGSNRAGAEPGSDAVASADAHAIVWRNPTAVATCDTSVPKFSRGPSQPLPLPLRRGDAGRCGGVSGPSCGGGSTRARHSPSASSDSISTSGAPGSAAKGTSEPATGGPRPGASLRRPRTALVAGPIRSTAQRASGRDKTETASAAVAQSAADEAEEPGAAEGASSALNHEAECDSAGDNRRAAASCAV